MWERCELQKGFLLSVYEYMLTYHMDTSEHTWQGWRMTAWTSDRKKTHQHIRKAVRTVARLVTGPRILSSDNTEQHGQWSHGFKSHSKHTFSSALFLCTWCPVYAGLTVSVDTSSVESYQTWAALASRIRGEGEGASERLTESHADGQADSWKHKHVVLHL
jgi:hypothetical protein